MSDYLTDDEWDVIEESLRAYANLSDEQAAHELLEKIQARETIDKPWCPCQKERFEAQYQYLPLRDMPYVDGVDYLEEVHSKQHYERKREKARDPNNVSRILKGPATPHTRRGTKIISKNFPDADYVCPCCEQTYVETTEVRKA